ncbi:MAG: hypothetical protein HKN23_14075 [Verrucomicrobiales bacterium]|nr:hypothetical protein [Verrucomicrobiales bacterium]
MISRLRNFTLLVGFLSLSLALAMVSPCLIAHEQKTALTDIFYNERTGNLEIAHRISVHDAEHALHKATDAKGDLAKSEKAREAFADYVAGRFTLILKDDQKLKLKLVGQELERGYLWVYQETKIPKQVGTPFFIENTILHDEIKGQVNTVNVRYRSSISTFVFQSGTGRKLYSRPEKAETVAE